MKKNTTAQAIAQWDPENAAFWQKSGAHIAKRNLWISIPCLMLAFIVWMLFSIVSVNLNKIGFHFTTNQLFLLTAIPSVSGAILRVPYSFVIPIFGGRVWTAFSTVILIVPCLWLGFAVQDTQTSFGTFIVIALLCGFGGANFASSMGNISFFFPKAQQGSALGLNGGLGNMGVSVIQMVAPVVILFPMLGGLSGASTTLENGQTLWLQNAAFVWVPFLLICSILAYKGMNALSTSKASLKEQLPVLKSPHLWILSLLYLTTFGSYIGYSAGFAMLSKTQFPHENILYYAFFGPFVGAVGRPLGGYLSDKLGGIRMTLINYILMALLAILVFTTLPTQEHAGNFTAFFLFFLGLFFTAGFGSGSTYQMISVAFRQITLKKLTESGFSDSQKNRIAGTETAAALGFISAIGAMGGFLIPQTFGVSLSLTHSAANAMIIFIAFYVVCAVVTWLCYGRRTVTA